jgi:hypothetical protein
MSFTIDLTKKLIPDGTTTSQGQVNRASETSNKNEPISIELKRTVDPYEKLPQSETRSDARGDTRDEPQNGIKPNEDIYLTDARLNGELPDADEEAAINELVAESEERAKLEREMIAAAAAEETKKTQTMQSNTVVIKSITENIFADYKQFKNVYDKMNLAFSNITNADNKNYVKEKYKDVIDAEFKKITEYNSIANDYNRRNGSIFQFTSSEDLADNCRKLYDEFNKKNINVFTESCEEISLIGEIYNYKKEIQKLVTDGAFNTTQTQCNKIIIDYDSFLNVKDYYTLKNDLLKYFSDSVDKLSQNTDIEEYYNNLATYIDVACNHCVYKDKIEITTTRNEIKALFKVIDDIQNENINYTDANINDKINKIKIEQKDDIVGDFRKFKEDIAKCKDDTPNANNNIIDTFINQNKDDFDIFEHFEKNPIQILTIDPSINIDELNKKLTNCQTKIDAKEQKLTELTTTQTTIPEFKLIIETLDKCIFNPARDIIEASTKKGNFDTLIGDVKITALNRGTNKQKQVYKIISNTKFTNKMTEIVNAITAIDQAAIDGVLKIITDEKAKLINGISEGKMNDIITKLNDKGTVTDVMRAQYRKISTAIVKCKIINNLIKDASNTLTVKKTFDADVNIAKDALTQLKACSLKINEIIEELNKILKYFIKFTNNRKYAILLIKNYIQLIKRTKNQEINNMNQILKPLRDFKNDSAFKLMKILTGNTKLKKECTVKINHLLILLEYKKPNKLGLIIKWVDTHKINVMIDFDDKSNLDWILDEIYNIINDKTPPIQDYANFLTLLDGIEGSGNYFTTLDAEINNYKAHVTTYTISDVAKITADITSCQLIVQNLYNNLTNNPINTCFNYISQIGQAEQKIITDNINKCAGINDEFVNDANTAITAQTEKTAELVNLQVAIRALSTALTNGSAVAGSSILAYDLKLGDEFIDALDKSDKNAFDVAKTNFDNYLNKIDAFVNATVEAVDKKTVYDQAVIANQAPAPAQAPAPVITQEQQDELDAFNAIDALVANVGGTFLSGNSKKASSKKIYRDNKKQELINNLYDLTILVQTLVNNTIVNNNNNYTIITTLINNARAARAALNLANQQPIRPQAVNAQQPVNPQQAVADAQLELQTATGILTRLYNVVPTQAVVDAHIMAFEDAANNQLLTPITDATALVKDAITKIDTEYNKIIPILLKDPTSIYDTYVNNDLNVSLKTVDDEINNLGDNANKLSDIDFAANVNTINDMIKYYANYIRVIPSFPVLKSVFEQAETYLTDCLSKIDGYKKITEQKLEEYKPIYIQLYNDKSTISFIENEMASLKVEMNKFKNTVGADLKLLTNGSDATTTTEKTRYDADLNTHNTALPNASVAAWGGVLTGTTKSFPGGPLNFVDVVIESSPVPFIKGGGRVLSNICVFTFNNTVMVLITIIILYILYHMLFIDRNNALYRLINYRKSRQKRLPNYACDMQINTRYNRELYTY